MTKVCEHAKSHYGNSMNVAYMRKWGMTIAERVIELIKDNKFPMLAYRGMSGTTAAISITSHIPEEYAPYYARVYVRKKNERSHGSSVEYSDIYSHKREVVVIVCDDFISSGTTVFEILMGLNSRLMSSVIDMDTVRFALSLGMEYSDVANTINTLEGALSIRDSSGAKDATKLRKKYAKALAKYEAERERARIERMEAMSMVFGI